MNILSFVFKLAFLLNIDRKHSIVKFAGQIQKIDAPLFLLLQFERLALQLARNSEHALVNVVSHGRLVSNSKVILVTERIYYGLF